MTARTFSLNHGQARLDTPSRQLFVDGVPARLGGRAFDLLVALVERHDRLVGKQELMDVVWPGLVVEEGNLHVHVFALRRLLGADSIVTVPGRGYRFAGIVDDGSAALPRVTTPDELTAPTRPLLGRERLLTDVLAALAQPGCRLLTLTGPGGAGKSRLALEVAARVGPARPGGAPVVLLAPVRESAAVLRAVAAALGLQDDGSGTLQAAVQNRLSERGTVLLLDNLEHLPDIAPWVVAVLQSAPRLQVLATSRTRLHLRDETVITVPPLALPAGDTPEAIRASPAVALFLQQAALQGRDLQDSDTEQRAAAHICRQLDGLPLAIELVAPRLRVMTPALLAARLEQRLDLLTGGAADTQTHHRSLREALAWSHDLLDEPARGLFCRLGLWVGGASLPAAEALLGDRHAAWQALEQLLQHHLVQRAPDVGMEPRFTMLETVREFALEALDAAGERAGTEQARANWLADWATALHQRFLHGERAQALAAYRAERGNILGALRWAFDGADDATLQARLVTHLVEAWDHDNDFQTGEAWYRRIHLPAVLAPLRVDLLLGGAGLANGQCHFDVGVQRAQQAAGLAQASGAGRQQALAWCYQARAESAPGVALALLRRGQAQLQALGLAVDAALMLWSLGKRLAQEGGYDAEAARVLADAHQRFTEMGDRWMAGMVRIQQALLLARRGERPAALRALAEGEAVAVEHDATFNVANVLHLRARFERDDGRLAAALALEHEAVRILVATGEARVAVQHCRWMAHLHARAGHVETAVRLLAAAGARFGDECVLSLTTVSFEDRADWLHTAQALRGTVPVELFEVWWHDAAPWTPAQALALSITTLQVASSEAAAPQAPGAVL